MEEQKIKINLYLTFSLLKTLFIIWNVCLKHALYCIWVNASKFHAETLVPDEVDAINKIYEHRAEDAFLIQCTDLIFTSISPTRYSQFAVIRSMEQFSKLYNICVKIITSQSLCDLYQICMNISECPAEWKLWQHREMHYKVGSSAHAHSRSLTPVVLRDCVTPLED